MTPNVEIERKFLLKGLPPRVAGARSVLIDQGYVAGTVVRERVRRMQGDGRTRFVRTVKLGQGMARQEFEEETTQEIFDALWSITRGKRLQKRRHYVKEGPITWEIDEFLDRSLVLAEAEIPTESYDLEIPDWLAPYVEREVTHEKRYGNHALAR